MLFKYIDGEPLGFNEIEKDLPAHSAKALLDSKWTFITQEVCFYFNFLLNWFSFWVSVMIITIISDCNRCAIYNLD
jgi:ABC-type protease/lipase transport system fused ATPase/permease subunit